MKESARRRLVRQPRPPTGILVAMTVMNCTLTVGGLPSTAREAFWRCLFHSHAGAFGDVSILRVLAADELRETLCAHRFSPHT